MRVKTAGVAGDCAHFSAGDEDAEDGDAIFGGDRSVAPFSRSMSLFSRSISFLPGSEVLFSFPFTRSIAAFSLGAFSANVPTIYEMNIWMLEAALHVKSTVCSSMMGSPDLERKIVRRDGRLQSHTASDDAIWVGQMAIQKQCEEKEIMSELALLR